ncbi:MAG: transposase [Pseudomonadota bacterium]|nr:transposase [Pseudomonadota bacterium]MEE3360246.1 transposase [Pseudomonadota bacterium]
MSNYIRPKIPGATVFCTVVLVQRGSTFLVDQIDLLRGAVKETRGHRPFQIDAWVVLPDHMHFVWTLPESDCDLGVRIGAMKARFTMKLRRAGFSPPSTLPVVRNGRYAGLKPGLRTTKRESAVWQRRFWEHHIRNDAEYRAYVQYCHINPVKHGFVERPEDWPYSTVHWMNNM